MKTSIKNIRSVIRKTLFEGPRRIVKPRWEKERSHLDPFEKDGFVDISKPSDIDKGQKRYRSSDAEMTIIVKRYAINDPNRLLGDPKKEFWTLMMKRDRWSKFYPIRDSEGWFTAEQVADYLNRMHTNVAVRKAKSYFKDNSNDDAFAYAVHHLNMDPKIKELRREFEDLTGYSRIETFDEFADATKMIDKTSKFWKFIPFMEVALAHFRRTKKVFDQDSST